MKFFSMPSDFNTETIAKYDLLNKTYEDSRVIETYGNITVGNYFGSGRLVSQMPKIDITDLRRYIHYSRERDIDFNYTINAPTMQNKEFTDQGARDIVAFLGRLYDAGVRSLTVTLPSMIELVQSTRYDFKIKASTICQITNANRAEAYKKMGIHKIVPDESINRDFSKLRGIRRVFGPEVELIVNQICPINCIYRMFHYNMIAAEPLGAANSVSINYFEHRCVLQQYKHVSHLLKLTWIRPEDLHYYSGIGINYFKLQGRHTIRKGGDPVRTLECYMKGDFDGNLIDLLTMFATMNSFKIFVDNKKLDGFLKPFYEIENYCKNDCTACNYCESFARKTKVIDYEEAEKVIELARDFYNEYDQYKQVLETVNAENNDGTDAAEGVGKKKVLLLKGKRHEAGDFDF